MTKDFHGRLCWICYRPTGDEQYRTCPLCEQLLSFIESAHRGNYEGRQPIDPVAHESRLKKYERLAADGLPLFVESN